ncbi:hypothetical protein ACIPYQ_37570 [Streptomyces sp. NPDC090045]|uniref:effector-associated constant component EACC1 n=1 Tax=Streptomyces sp. NPDC090045 TaxID=3365927 RepID=UPI00382958C5
MRITLDAGGPAETDDLREWLRRNPQLRSHVGTPVPAAPDSGSMSGGATEIVPLLLAPGGLTAAVAAAVVAWLQSRKVNQTVTITRPDGTQVTVTSEGIDGRAAQNPGDLAQQVAAALHQATPQQQEPQPQPQQQRTQPAAAEGAESV